MTFTETESASFNRELFEFDRSTAHRYAEWSISNDYPNHELRYGLQTEHKRPSLDLIWGGQNHLDPKPDFLGQVWCVYEEHPEVPPSILVVAATAGEYPLRSITLPGGVILYEGTRLYLEFAIREMLTADENAWKVAVLITDALSEGRVTYLHIETVYNDNSEIETVLTTPLEIHVTQNDEVISLPIKDVIQQVVEDFLLLLFPLKSKPYLFDKINAFQALRLYELATAYLRNSTSDDATYKKAVLLAYQQAAYYALSQNSSDILEFCNHLELYLVLLQNTCLTLVETYQCRMLELSLEQFDTDDLSSLNSAQYRHLSEQASQQLIGQSCIDEIEIRQETFIQEVYKSRKIQGDLGHKINDNSKDSIEQDTSKIHELGEISLEIQRSTKRIYNTVLKKFGGVDHFGKRERIGFSQMNPYLAKNDMQKIIQQRNENNEICFESESGGVLQVLKHFNALPECEKNLGRTYVTSYLRSAKETIANPTEPVVLIQDAAENKIFIFRRKIMKNGESTIAEARVRVTTFKRLTLLSYRIVNSDVWRI